MESRVRTMSRGYVRKTDVMPAKPPQMSRVKGESGASGYGSKMLWHIWISEHVSLREVASRDDTRQKGGTHPLVKVVTAKLHRRIGHDPDAIGPVAPHEAPPALLHPHLLERLGDAELVGLAARALDLHEDLEALERGDDGAGDGPRDAAGAEGGDDGLGEPIAELDGESALDGRGGGGRGGGCRFGYVGFGLLQGGRDGVSELYPGCTDMAVRRRSWAQEIRMTYCRHDVVMSRLYVRAPRVIRGAANAVGRFVVEGALSVNVKMGSRGADLP